jgi:hypothetical protein
MSRCLCCDNKKYYNLIIRPWDHVKSLLLEEALIASTVTTLTWWLKRCILGFPMEYVEACASRAGFVLPRDGMILWAHSVRFHPMLRHVTRSQGWNITERVNDNVGNEIELGVEIPTIKSRILHVSQKQREWNIDVCGSTTKSPSWMHKDHHGYPDPIDDHLSKRCLDNV